MKHILHIVGDSKYGGGSKVIEDLVIAALEDGFRVTVLATDTTLIQRIKFIGGEVIELDCIWRKISIINDLKGLLILTSFLRKNRFDIVHTHTTKAGLIGRIAAKLAKVGLIIHTIHGFAFGEDSAKKKIVFYTLIEKLAAFFCHKIVTVSEYHRKWALSLKISSSTKIVCIPNGITINFNDKDVTYVDPVSISFVGRLVKEKGIDDLIRAVQLLVTRPNIPAFKIDIFGDGPDKNYFLEQLSLFNVEQYFCFHGFVENVEERLVNTEIFVLPSYREGLSISLLEAMNHNCSIIATAIGSNKEVLADGKVGLLYESHDVKALSILLEKLVVDPSLRSKLAKSGRAIVESKYSKEKMTSAYIELYNKGVS